MSNKVKKKLQNNQQEGQVQHDVATQSFNVKWECIVMFCFIFESTLGLFDHLYTCHNSQIITLWLSFYFESILTVFSALRYFQCDHNMKPFKNFQYKKIQRSVIQTLFQNSFSFPDSCVVGHPHEVVTTDKNGKTVLTNKFIALFPAMFETYNTAGNSNYAKTQINNNEGKITIKITKSAKVFLNDPVGYQQKEQYPDFKNLIDNYPKDSIQIEVVPVVRYTHTWWHCRNVFIPIFIHGYKTWQIGCYIYWMLIVHGFCIEISGYNYKNLVVLVLFLRNLTCFVSLIDILLA